MLTQSKETRDAWRASQRTLDIKVMIDGKTYGATDVNSLKYDSGAYNGDTFAIGSTYSNTVQIEFSHLIEGLKLGMEVRPSIGIKTSSGYVYEPLGVFIISSEIKMDRNNNLTTVSASDRFCGLEGAYVSKLTYPAKVLDVIAEICAQSGVKANTDDLARLPHQADLPAPITGQSYRKALGWIAQLYVGYALFDRQGLFTIRTISEPNYELDPSQYEQAGLTKNEAAYKINGIQCQVTLTTKTRNGESTEETKTYQAGDATGSQIKLENNIMTPQQLNDIWEQLKDLTFYPFSLNWFGNPAVEAGDWLRLEDKQGNSFVVPNSSYTLDFNGGLSATSKADQTTSSDQMVPWQGSVAQTIKELKIRRSPDGTVVFPPSVTAPPTNAKFNDVWFKKNGNSTELWIFEKQDDGSGKWIRKDLSDDEIKKKVADAQQGLNQAKVDIINNKQKADADIENLNKSIEDNKKVADESLQKLNDSVTNLQGQYDNNVVPNLNKVMSDASDALQKYITAQNSIADLTKQAQQQGKDIADVSNTVKGLNINYANLAGDVNSTKVDVKGLQTTVGTANSDIAQLKLNAQNLQTMLAGKVDNTTYANFVNLTNQALNARLTASDLNGYAKTVDVQATANGLKFNIDSVTDRMNNLKVGGRNLVTGTDQEYTMGFGIPNTTWKDGFAYATLPTTGSGNEILPQDPHVFWYTLTAGQEYTQTIWFKTDATIKDLKAAGITWYTANLHDYQPATIQKNGPNSYKMFSSYKWPGKQNNDVRLFDISELRQAFDLKTGTYLKFGKLKLETGNVSTDWTPAVEDTAHDLAQLSARITTTSQQFSSYYTKSETDNRTNSAKNDAINTIRNDGKWQGLNNILTNSGFLQTADGFIQKVQQTTIPMFNGGGINLVQGTAKFNFPLQSNGGVQSLQKYDNETNYIQHTASQPSFIGPWFGTFTPEIGKTYTISADVAGNGYITGDIFRYEGNDSSTLNRVDLTDNWQRISNTIHVNKISGNWVIYASNSTLLKIKHVKIEEGYVATPWSPSPFDLATQVSFSELSQSLDGLRSTVGSNYGNLQSQISQSASTVRTELIDKVNGVQNQLTSTADSLSLKITNLKIGARNLLHNTSDQYRTLTGDGWMGVHTSSDEYTSVASYHNGNLFTYAATISNTSDVPVELQVWRCDQNKNRLTNGMLGISAYVYPGQKDVRVFLTGSIDNNTWYLQSAVYSSGGQSGQHTIQVKDERLVEGAYAGTWSSNPNDVAKNIIDLNATLQGLQSTVSGNYGNLQSQINQTATTLRGEVTDKVNGLQSQITTQANNINLMLGTAGDLSNICRNPTFDNHDGWTDSVHVESNWSEIPTKNAGVLFERDGYYGDFFTVSKGEKYYFSVFGHSGSQYAFCLGLQFLLNNGEYSWQGASWIQSGETKTAEGRLVVPNNAVSARVWVSLQGTSNFGWVRFTNVVVKKNDTLAQINMSAGTTLIQNDKIYMDSSSTIFSGKAFIPDAAITNISADKITAGTLDAGRINVINLNANNITTGTINGQNLKINLDTGNVEFQHGHIHNFNNSVDIDLDQNYISVSSWSTKAMLKNGELQLIQPQLFDLSSDPYFRLYNGGSGSDWSAAYLEGRSGIFISPKGYKGNSVLDTVGSLGANRWAGFYTGYENGGALSPTAIGGADKGVVIHGGAKLSQTSNIFSGDGGTLLEDTPHIHIGIDGGGRFGGNRIVIEGEYVHVPTAWRHTTGDAPNLFIANDGALVRSTSASKYKTEIHRDYSTNYGDRLLELPTATWIDKGQKERYQAGQRSIKPKKYFGMIAEDLADAGLDLLVSKNADGEIEGIQYERIAPALIPVIRKLKKKVQQLEEKLNE
ncbi:peptidase [Limosilactobacillus reuteri]|uniref:peptidase n=1 Tax=Limosilactobacillus reuteri TaxID=1598 RepID=UPI001E4A542F|nr:peptidase [Limosilactobacillus reuteri]MCC4366394.1 peptidase [Limosilactobacillus reuteri]